MADTGPGGGDVFDLDRLRRLVELMKEHDLSQVDLRQGEQRIAMRRGAQEVFVPNAAAPPPVARPAAESRPAASAPSAPVADANAVFIKSPMVGTFYSRANPKADPYVKVGDYVQESSVVCLIEAMKTYTEVQAEVSGRIIAALVQEGEPVEFGQNLFKIEKK